MKNLTLFLSLLIPLQILLVTPNETFARTPANLPLEDVKYDFPASKIEAAKNPYRLLRSVVDYFYLLANANQKNLPIVTSHLSTSAWCMGDAHQENFGFILLDNGKSIFTINDFDDAGPCPAILDLFRFMVSARLFDKDIQLTPLMDAYLAGLQLQDYKMPPELKKLNEKSLKDGRAPRASKVKDNRLVRDDASTEPTAAEQNEIKKSLAYLKPFLSTEPKILDIIATAKIGGGSGGLQRYEVLLEDKKQLIHLEFKEQVMPAIYPVATEKLPSQLDRVMTTLANTQGANRSFYYNVVAVGGKTMLIRPRFDGNVGISLGKKANTEDKAIIRYEAYTLGVIHARSIASIPSWAKALQGLSPKAWDQEVSAMVQQFESKFAELKP